MDSHKPSKLREIVSLYITSRHQRPRQGLGRYAFPRLLVASLLTICPMLHRGHCQDTATPPATQTETNLTPPLALNREVLIVIGAPGEDTYAKEFRNWAERWKTALQLSAIKVIDGTQPINTDEQNAQQKTDLQAILDWIDTASNVTPNKQPAQLADRWLVFIGHGTDDGGITKFNLRGPDISAKELSKALDGRTANWTVINCHSSSSPFINAVSKKDRIVVTATKSGSEQNYSRFGEYLSMAITDEEADLDHDRAVSLLEAFLAASNRTAQFYADENRLASEQALLDDNGDGKGTPAAFYRGTRAVKAPAEGMALDGSFAAKKIVRYLGELPTLTSQDSNELVELESQVEEVRKLKQTMGTDEYYEKLESLFLKIARLRLKE